MKAPSKEVASAVDDFSQNPGEFVIYDAVNEADIVWVPDSASVPVSDQLQESIDGVNTAIEPGITTVDKRRVDRRGDDQVILSSIFTDTKELGIGEFYAVAFKIRPAAGGGDIELARSSVHSSQGIEIVDNDDGTHTAELAFNPVDTLDVGAYDVYFEVERRSIVFTLAIIIVVGVISTLIYFYFSKPHTGVLGVTAKVGIWFIMVAFGAHFGFTVMGRVSLLIGRVQFLIEDWIGSFSQLM
jgi:hypothetical protein